MNQLKVFKNELFEVSTKIEGDTILFDAEHVARCLGFTTVAKSGNVTIRWSRVNEYLPTDLPQVAKGDLIPESLVYKLAFKASNEVAEKFQNWLAIEVIPSIRKYGTYQSQQDPLELALQTSLKNYQEIKGIKEDVNLLKDSMRIDGRQEFAIKSQGKAKVMETLGGYNSPAYNALSKKVFSRMWRDFKNHFVLPRSPDLPKARFDEAVKFIAMWRPDTSTAMEIDSYNNQTHLKLVQ